MTAPDAICRFCRREIDAAALTAALIKNSWPQSRISRLIEAARANLKGLH